MTTDTRFYYKKSRMQQLKGFCYTVQLGTTTKAAQKMGLTSSSITMQIKSLEEALGVKLFTRDKQRLQITKDGERLYKMSMHHIKGLESLFDDFLEEKNTENSTVLNIAAQNIIISYILPKFVKHFQQSHPDVTLTFFNIDKIKGLTKVRDREIDLAIYPYYEEEDNNFPELETIKVFEFDPTIIMHKDHPLAKVDEKSLDFDDIAKYSFLRTDSDNITLPIFKEASKQYGINSKIKFVNGTWEMAREFVRENLGIAGVSNALPEDEDGAIVSKNVTRMFTKMTYAAGVPKQTVRKNIADDFINLLKLKS